mmetsp:Transcript_8247/g.51351  ORF Transcript_8247/g.51351 Transcript_8247/m.51351 type:complete len:203 (+) Transcript_8247:1071-1679(+)
MIPLEWRDCSFFPPEQRGGRKPFCQHIASGLCNQELVLELGAPLPILCDGSPTVRPGAIVPGPQVDHRLDCKNLALLHHPNGFVVRVVWYAWRAVEELSNAVSTVCFDYAAIVRVCMIGNDLPQVPEPHARLHCLDGLHEAVVRSLDHPFAVIVHLPDDEGLVEISVVAILAGGDVHIQDVSFLQLPLVRYAMADHLVHGGT